jgi:hypothetical protein
MNRQFRRRVEREWKKIKLGASCTVFVERNGLFSIPYVLYFQAVKVSEDLMCVYNVSLFEIQEDSAFPELATVCQFVNGLFRSLGSVELGFVSEQELDRDEEVES